MVIIDENDVSLLVDRCDSARETFVDSLILLVCSGFVEHLGFRGVGDGIMETRP